MRMQDKVKVDSQEELAVEVSDDPVQQPQDAKKAVRIRVFTRWINALLSECDPPVEVHDLLTDIQDGSLLMALLEELSGYKLLYRFRSSSHRIFRLNNISKALAFLDDRHVKLLGIDASSVADGTPSVVLNLLWNIILHFQVKEVTGSLQRRVSSSLSSLSVSSSSSAPQLTDFSSHSCTTLQSKSRKSTRKQKYKGRAVKTLLQWVQGCTSKFGVEVHDFGKSWRSGLAFLAVIKSINPALVDLRESLARESRENIQLAFDTARHSLDIPPLLEPDDVLCSSPDEKSIITYVSMFLMHVAGVEEAQKEDTGLPEIPNFGSLESVTLGDIDADNPDAKTLLTGFERSSEQRLWRRWARRHPGSTRTLHSCGAAPSELSSSCGDIFTSCQSQAGSPTTSTFAKRRCKSRCVFKPPSPLDAGIGSPEIRSWLENASAGQSHSKPNVDESRFSLSSEEGIYNLSALDSDEEEAYNYILELNQEDAQPYNQPKRQVPRVEEETEEEMLLSGQQSDEAKHVEVYKHLTGNGCEHQEGSRPAEQNTFRFRESLKEDGGEKNKAVVYESKKTNLCEANRETEGRPLEKTGHVSEMTAVDKEENEEQLRTFEDRQHRKLGTETESAKEEERGNQPKVLKVENIKVEVNLKIIVDKSECEVREAGVIRRITHEEENGSTDHGSRREDLTSNNKNQVDLSDEVKGLMDVAGNENSGELQIKRRALGETTEDHPGEAPPKTDSNHKVHSECWTPASGATSQSLRGGGFILQSLAASCGVTPLELKVLLVLWILIYCCLILQQIHL